MKKHELQIIGDYFSDREIINEDEIKKIILELFPEKNEKYFNYYMMELYRNNILYKYGIGKYKPNGYRKKFDFKLDIDSELIHKLEKLSPSILISIWNTDEISYLTSLQMLNNMTIIETYSYAKEYILDFLLNEGKFAIYEEDYSIMTKYSKMDQLFIIRTLNEDCPIIRRSFFVKGHLNMYEKPTLVTVPKIEKIIVDFLVDKIYQLLFSDEINNVIYQLLKNYQINIGTVLRYAKNRHSKEKLLKYFNGIGFDVESGEFR